MTLDDRKRRIRFRASHRGTKEADLLIGGFMERELGQWGEPEVAWFEALLEEQDADILSWAIGTATPPARYEGVMMQAMRQLDYIVVAR